MAFVEPKSGRKSFTCPHCQAIARQYHRGYMPSTTDANPRHEDHGHFAKTEIRVSQCEHCGKVAIWHKDTMVYPDRSSAPPPNSDMPDEARADYEEASSILSKSPRGAAALLRLAIQKLSIHLGGKGKNLNADIGALVKRGLPEQVRKSLDVVRVTGNNAVHPGQIDAGDEEVASDLFPLVNVIVEYMISLPAKLDALHEALPEGAKEAIARRDERDGEAQA